MAKRAPRRGLARVSPLEYTARPFDELEPLEDQYSTSIRTDLYDSRSLRPGGIPRRASPDLAVRASFRSSFRHVKQGYVLNVVVPPSLRRRALNCAHRTIRREVLFALNRKTGRGSGGSRRRSFRSSTKC